MANRKYLGYAVALAMIFVVGQVGFVLAVPTIANSVPVFVYTFLPLAVFASAASIGYRIAKSKTQSMEALK